MNTKSSMTTFDGSSETTERSLDRSVMTFDLPAILGSMKKEATWLTARRNAMTLVKQPIFRVVLVALRAGAEIGAHDTESPITIQVIEGRLAIRLGTDEFVLGAGQLLVLRPGLHHTMSAQDDAAFLLTLAAEATHPAEHFA
jgi:quercetin dioxygenase-like cupin family protein